MMDKLSHRGPDDLAMGFTRLSIIDLEGGMQPLTT